MFCGKCGKNNNEENEFCSSCGNQLTSISELGLNTNAIERAPDTKIVFAVLGWIFNALALFVIPILFATGGFIFGYLYRKVSKTHGTIIMIAAVSCGLFGSVIGAIVGLQLLY
jgi:uncharacterized membrane protein YvbJ